MLFISNSIIIVYEAEYSASSILIWYYCLRPLSHFLKACN